MRLLARRKTPTEELKDAAIEALVNALDDDKRAAKPGTKGVRALAAGAVIYTAGHAAFKGQRFVREQLSSDTEDDQAEDLEDEKRRARTRSRRPRSTRSTSEPRTTSPRRTRKTKTSPTRTTRATTSPTRATAGRPATSGGSPGRRAIEEPEARREPDDESRSKTPTPLPERKPMRRAARKKSAQPSLKLPKQRRARTWMSKD